MSGLPLLCHHRLLRAGHCNNTVLLTQVIIRNPHFKSLRIIVRLFDRRPNARHRHTVDYASDVSTCVLLAFFLVPCVMLAVPPWRTSHRHTGRDRWICFDNGCAGMSKICGRPVPLYNCCGNRWLQQALRRRLKSDVGESVVKVDT